MTCYYCKDGCFEVVAESKDMRFQCYGKHKWILRCLNCGLVQLLPQWTEKELEELYSKYWDKKDFKGQKRKVRISKYLANYIKPLDNCLEIGNGHGDNIRFLREQGYWVVGVDKDQKMRGEIKADIFEWVPDKKYDFIYAIHLFEHMADPMKFIEWIRSNLSYKGRYLLEIPSLSDPLLKLKAFRKYYWYPYHLFFYDKETIRKFFPEADIIPRQEYGLINHLRWLFLGKPGNWNPHIPVLDDIYKMLLESIGRTDSMVIVGDVRH